jgi:hypothetical protein
MQLFFRHHAKNMTVKLTLVGPLASIHTRQRLAKFNGTKIEWNLG